MMRVIIVNFLIVTSASTSAQMVSRPEKVVPTQRDIRELSVIFRQVDADRNGRLTKVEMSAFGIAHGLGTLVKRKGWRDIDANRDGTLTLAEFIPGMVSARASMYAHQSK